MHDKEYMEKIHMIEAGKKEFYSHMDGYGLTTQDAVIVVLTEDKDCIGWGLYYLPQFIRKYKIHRVFIFMNSDIYVKEFSMTNVNPIVCTTKAQVQQIALYLSLFDVETKIVFLTNRDSMGAKVEELLQKQEFTLEEYVAIGLYRLDEVMNENGYDYCANI